MTYDKNEVRDELQVELNPEPADAPESDTDPIPDRPADGAKADKWRAYVQALGAHPDTVKDLKPAELRDLADRIGG